MSQGFSSSALLLLSTSQLGNPATGFLLATGRARVKSRACTKPFLKKVRKGEAAHHVTKYKGKEGFVAQVLVTGGYKTRKFLNISVRSLKIILNLKPKF